MMVEDSEGDDRRSDGGIPSILPSVDLVYAGAIADLISMVQRLGDSLNSALVTIEVFSLYIRTSYPTLVSLYQPHH